MSEEKIVSGDAMALNGDSDVLTVAYMLGGADANARLRVAQAEIARLRSIIERLECIGDHCMDEPVTPFKDRCMVCRAKAEAANGSAK